MPASALNFTHFLINVVNNTAMDKVDNNNSNDDDDIYGKFRALF